MLKLPKHTPTLLLIVFLCYFWGNGIAQLERFPRVHEDEPWIASPGYTFWSEGRFGSDMFAGFYGMERNYFGFMPLYPMLMGASLKLFGMGLFQARLTSLFLSLLLLSLTYRLGSVLFSHWHGLCAVMILCFWRLSVPLPNLGSGIPLADLARLARYDVAASFFGLLAYFLTVSAFKQGHFSRLRAVLVGGCVGLATLSHVYGLFWLVPLAAAVLFHAGLHPLKKVTLQTLCLIALGFFLVMLPWGIFAGVHWQDFRHQTLADSERFDLTNPDFYRESLAHEKDRYQPILDGAHMGYGGARLWLWGGIASLLWLVLRSVKGDPSAPLVIIPILTIAALFALLINYKTYFYLVMLFPMMALAIAVGLLELWRIKIAGKLALAVCCLTAGVEGLQSAFDVHQDAHDLTPYLTFTQEIEANLPPNSRTMGMHHYWFGLEDYTANYRSILVPIYWTNPNYVVDVTTFGAAVEAIPPDYFLLDESMINFLNIADDPAHPFHELYVQINSFLRQHGKLISQFYDHTYGHMKIYKITP